MKYLVALGVSLPLKEVVTQSYELSSSKKYIKYLNPIVKLVKISSQKFAVKSQK
jgi:hypothetical protein